LNDGVSLFWTESERGELLAVRLNASRRVNGS
jgi:hypothetical protein